MRNVEKLQTLLKTYEKITIIGHDNIDVDAFISGILLSNLLKFLGIENEFLILEKVKEDETYHIVKEIFNIDMKNYYSSEECSKRKLFLEDHYETLHEGEVIACLDHHLTEDMIVNKYPFYHSRVSCSASYMVYEMMLDAGYIISKEEAKMILVSMLIDTVSFRSRKTVKSEVMDAKKLCKQYDLAYDELEKYCLCLTPVDTLSTKQIINNGYKYHNYYGKRVKSSYIQIYGNLEEAKISRCINDIVERLKREKLEMWVFIVLECKDEITYEYRITQSSIEKVKSRGILSRGTNIMPKIEKILKQKNGV